MSSYLPAVAQAIRKLKAGRPDEAVGPLREAARLQPGDAAIQHDLGLACLETGAFPDAVDAFRRAVTLQPGYTDAHFRLGLALERLGDVRGAVLAYDRATELQPSLAEAWYRAGSLVFTLGHREEAIGCFRRAASSGRSSSFGRLGEARALLAEDRDPQAERVLRHVLADAGRFAEARECFARAIAAGPSMAGSYYDLVRCRRMTTQDADLLPRMQAALAISDLPSEQRIRVHLALGKAHDDLGYYQAAMAQFDAADNIRRTLMAFDATAFDTQVDRLISRFSPELIARARVHGRSDVTPVLIMGLPRSGTTLTEQIVSSHSEVGAGGELNFFNERGPVWLADGRAPNADHALAQISSDYVTLLRATAPGKTHVTDKMPFNFLWAGLIHLAFPNAVLLHCRRADIDAALSIRRIIEACGLRWEQACMRPELNSRAVKTPSRWQARQPIYRDAVERWRRYELWLGPLGALLDDEARHQRQ